MNLFYLQWALLNRTFLMASLDATRSPLYLTTAYPGYPIDRMVNITLTATEIAVLAKDGKCQYERLIDPLNVKRLEFSKRPVLEEILYWAMAYLRYGTSLESSYGDWCTRYLHPAQRRDGERYRAVNEVLFEYAYRLINKFPGGPNNDIPWTGFIERYIQAHATDGPDDIYSSLNLSCGFTVDSKTWKQDVIFSPIYKGTLQC